jgi:hypothetical protein
MQRPGVLGSVFRSATCLFIFDLHISSNLHPGCVAGCKLETAKWIGEKIISALLFRFSLRPLA